MDALNRFRFTYDPVHDQSLSAVRPLHPVEAMRSLSNPHGRGRESADTLSLYVITAAPRPEEQP